MIDTIKTLCEEATEEIQGAENYAKMALKYKTEHPAMSKMFASMSQQELDHAENLRKMAWDMLQANPDEALKSGAQMLYNYIYERNMGWITKVKVMHSLL